MGEEAVGTMQEFVTHDIFLQQKIVMGDNFLQKRYWRRLAGFADSCHP